MGNSVARDVLNREKYGWSKWGGGRKGIVREGLEDRWFCQACGQEQPHELPPYLFAMLPREYIRVCSQCEFVIVHRRITTMQGLLHFVKPSR